MKDKKFNRYIDINNSGNLLKKFFLLASMAIFFSMALVLPEAKAYSKDLFFKSIEEARENPILYPEYKEDPEKHSLPGNDDWQESEEPSLSHEDGPTNKFVKVNNDYGYYYDRSGNILRSTLVKSSDGKLYYAPKNGKIPLGRIGAFTADGKVYYRLKSGNLHTGWIKDKGKSFYYNPHMLTDCYENIGKNPYYFDKDGRAQDAGSYSVKNEWSYNSGRLSGPAVRERTVGNNHIVISLRHQYLWLFKNHRLFLNTPIISGKPSSPTIRGNFVIQVKATDKTLVGPDYSSPVNYWLPFSGSYGIHDAAWQRSRNFYKDSSSYKRVGSHGCVNILPSVMPKIFNNIFTGAPVTVY